MVGLVLTGVVSYTELGVPDPIAVAVDATGDSLLWLRPIVKVGAIFGLTSVIMVTILSQSRIFFAMAADGLLPPSFARVHPRYKTPVLATVITGVIAAIISGFLPIDILGEMVSIGEPAAREAACMLQLRRRVAQRCPAWLHVARQTFVCACDSRMLQARCSRSHSSALA